MKKLRFYFVLCSMFLMSLAACGTAEQEEVPVSAPTVTTAPEPTEAPEVTVAPTATATPVPAEEPVKEITYTFQNLEYVTSYGVEYSVKEDGSVDLQFANQWQEIKFKYPEEIAVENCTGVTVNAKSEYGNLAFKLFGENFLNDPYCAEEYIYTECKGEGVKEYEFSPVLKNNLYGLGIMAMEVPADASAYTATVYSITFHFEENAGPKVAAPDKGDIIYTLDNADCIKTTNASFEPAENGGVNLQFDKLWGEVRLRLPEGIDLSECICISVEMDTYGNNICYNLFDERIFENKHVDGVESLYNCNQRGTALYNRIPSSGKTVYAIGIGAGSEVQNPETYVATVYSVTFYMLSGNKVEVPLDVAPNVTEDMTLRNTYGELFGKVGTSVSLWDLESPAYLELVKSQYNSVTSGWEAKMDQVIMSNPTLISVEDAKRYGYVIPDNYKETVVPKFNFDTIDKTLKICAENGLSYRVHTLIWHQQALDWFFRTDYAYGGKFVSPEVMDARMEMYIRTVMEHICTSPYADIVYAWDVVNEYIHFDNVNYENYTAIYGPINRKPEFVKLAFTIADDMLKKHGLEDRISLFYNDYNTYVYDEWGKNNKQEILSLIEFINSDGKVCDGVGMQTHLMLEHFPDWRDTFKETVQAFLDAGLEVQLTEIGVSEGSADITEEQKTEAYVELMTDVLELKKAGGNISGITFWGMADMDLAAKPYLFEKPGRPKEVYYRVLQTYQEAKLGLAPVAKPAKEPTSKPTQAPTPTPKPTATPTPVPTKAPDANNELTFTFDEMKVLMEHNLSYKVEADGSLWVKINAQYGGIKFVLPQGIDLADCESVTVKMKSEYSSVAPQLCEKDVLSDPWLPEKYITFGCQGDGVKEYELYQEGSGEIWAIGFMGTENVEDFSKYEVEVYSITFRMK